MNSQPQWLNEAYAFAGTKTTILIEGTQTEGRYALLSVRVPAGNATPPHSHDVDTETVMVLAGAMTVETPGRSAVVQPGEVVVLPPREVHRLSNAGPQEASYLLLCAPAGFEGFVREVGRRIGDDGAIEAMDDGDVQRLVAAAPAHGVRLSDGAALVESQPDEVEVGLSA